MVGTGSPGASIDILAVITHLGTSELERGLDHVRHSPMDGGAIDLIVRRPKVGEREVVAAGRLDVEEGLVGDSWRSRGSGHMPDAAPDPEMQITIMNSRLASLIAVDPDRRGLAGDQLYVDMDLSNTNLPPGTRLHLGSAVVEVSATPHTGCRKFADRFGKDALVLVNSEYGRSLNLRGVNAKVVESGDIRTGDVVTKVSSPRR